MSRVSKPSRASAILVATAATLGAMTAYNVYRARKTEREHPPTGRFVTVDGVRLHYLEKGEGSPVVLLHGNVVTAEDFQTSGVLDLLARRHRVIAFDRPGFGYSDRPHGSAWSARAQADLLRDAFVILGINRPVVLGHSLGAAVALALALNHPDDVRGLVLLSGYYYPTLRADVLLSSPPAIPILGDLLALFDLTSPWQTIAAAAAQGNVRTATCTSQLRDGLYAKHVGTTRTDPRRESRRRRHDSRRHRDAAPLSGIDNAGCYHGGYEGSCRQCQAARAGFTRRFRTASSGWFLALGTCFTTQFQRRSLKRSRKPEDWRRSSATLGKPHTRHPRHSHAALVVKVHRTMGRLNVRYWH